MKTTFHLIILKAIIFLGTNILASDSYHVTRSNGYHYTINDSGAYQWASVENAVPINFPLRNAIPGYYKDDDILRIPIGFSFKYFGIEHTTVIVSTNGTLSFDGNFDAAKDSENVSLLEGPKNLIAPFWDDLHLGNGVILLETKGDVGSRECIVTWHNVSVMNVPSHDGIYFQVILRESTGEIVFNYHDVSVADETVDNGVSATVGIINEYGNIIAQYSYLESKLYNGLTLVFQPMQGNGLPSIISPIQGQLLESNQITVEWEPADVDVQNVYLGIGTQLHWYDIVHVKISPGSPIFNFNGMPTNGSDLFLKLFIEDKQNQYQTNVILKSKTSSDLDFRGIISGNYGYRNRGIIDPIVTLRSLNENFEYFERMRVGTEGRFHFSGLKQGSYQFRVISTNSRYFLSDGYYNEEISLNEKTTLRNYDFRKQIIDASPFPGEWLRNATPYFLLGNTDYKNLLWILKDSNGNEIVRKELGNQTHYTHDNDLDAGKTYFWDLYSRSDTGEIEASIENRQFQIKDPTIPQLTSPVQCEGKTYKHKLYIGWKTGTIPVEKWRVTIRQNERSEVFITKEYDINQLYDIVIIPSHYESCVVEFSYYSNNEWVSETSEIDLELIDLNIEILTPTENSQIADSNLTTRFRISGSDSKYINENSLRVQLIHNNKSIFDSDSCITDFKVLENGEFSYTIGVVPSNSENIDLVISGYLHDSFDGYPARHNPNSELSNPFDYFESRRSITCANKPESVSGYEYKSGNYNWIDATVGVKIPLKGKLDIINQHRQHWYADIETPFPIEFYGASYNSVRIMERGIISFSHAFEPGETDFTAHMLNADYPNNVIAPFPGNLSLRNGGGIYHHTIGESPDRKFIIQWNQMNNYNDESEGAYTFQLVFTENSDDIMFQYKDVDISSTQYHIPSHYDFGAFSIIGLKNQDGTKSTIYSIKSSVVNNEEAILFTPL